MRTAGLSGPVPEKGDPLDVTHGHSERMVKLATEWLYEYFSDGKARRPGDLEDDFTGEWSLWLGVWRKTPFYPALAVLVRDGRIVFGTAKNRDIWYALPGKLPKGTK